MLRPKAQSFWEGTIGIGMRWWIQPWLSFGVVEGVSINSALSNYEAASWENSAQFLNYLAAEIAVQINHQWSVLGGSTTVLGPTAPMTELKKAVTATCSVFVTTSAPHPSRESKVKGCHRHWVVKTPIVISDRFFALEQQLEAVVFDGPSAQQAA